MRTSDDVEYNARGMYLPEVQELDAASTIKKSIN